MRKKLFGGRSRGGCDLPGIGNGQAGAHNGGRRHVHLVK